tara:strand:- start:356 stop:571 length:216 start_codon:yes stop_codon:yes gene_type:complete
VKKIEIHWANHQELHPAGKISPAGGDRFHQLVSCGPSTTDNELPTMNRGSGDPVRFPCIFGNGARAKGRFV